MENRRYKQRKLTPEQRLFERTVTLAFLSGLAFGLIIWFGGTDVYNLISSGWSPLSPLSPPSLAWPLNALQLIVIGSFILLSSAFNNSYSQFLKGPQWKKDRNAFLEFSDRLSRPMGFFFIGFGLLGLLLMPLHFAITELKGSATLELVFDIVLTVLFMLIGPGVLSWYLHVRDRRNAMQEE